MVVLLAETDFISDFTRLTYHLHLHLKTICTHLSVYWSYTIQSLSINAKQPLASGDQVIFSVCHFTSIWYSVGWHTWSDFPECCLDTHLLIRTDKTADIRHRFIISYLYGCPPNRLKWYFHFLLKKITSDNNALIKRDICHVWPIEKDWFAISEACFDQNR